MVFKISDKQLIKKVQSNMESWKLLETKFDSKTVYDDNDKYIKTKIKLYNGSMITNFHGKKIQNKKHHASVYQ